MIIRASLISIAASVFLYFFISVIGLLDSLPDDKAIISLLEPNNLSLSSEVFDYKGAKITDIFIQKRYYTKINRIPKSALNSFVYAEDIRFYKHSGLDFIGMARAFLANMRSQEIKQGASTITQQLARNIFLNNEKKWQRKIREIFLALKLEKILSKDEILELYLNRIYFGNGAYGIEAASRIYFSKNTKDLNLGEATLLASLPKAPSRLALNKNYSKAQYRQTYILKNLLEDKKISQRQFNFWLHRKVKINKHVNNSSLAGNFIDQVTKIINKKLAGTVLNKSGLKIYTTLDLHHQKKVEDFFESKLKDKTSLKNKFIESAYVALNKENGAVRVMQGSKSYKQSHYNRAIHTKRPIYELIQPIILANLFEKGINYEQALKLRIGHHSNLYFKNLMTFDKLGFGLGENSLLNSFQALGLEKNKNDFYSTPMSLAAIYSIFFNSGFVIKPYFIEKVETQAGEVIIDHVAEQEHRLISEKSAYLSAYFLRDLVRYGAGKAGKSLNPEYSGIPAGNKQSTDLWFVGKRGHLVSTLWLGSEYGKQSVISTKTDRFKYISTFSKDLTKIFDESYFPKEKKTSPNNIVFYRKEVSKGIYRTLPVEIF